MSNNSNNNSMNNNKSTRIFCPHCGGSIYLQDHECHVSGIAIGKDSGLGDIVLAPGDGSHINTGSHGGSCSSSGSHASSGHGCGSGFQFTPHITKDDTYIQKLRDAGIDTSDYFVISGRGGQQQIMKYDSNEIPVAVSIEEIERIIEENGMDGYIKNTRFARRFLAAYFMKGLSYKGGMSAYLNSLGYRYSLKVLVNEFHTMAALETRDEACYYERNRFFTKDTLIDVIDDIEKKLRKHIDRLGIKRCKGKAYKVIYGKQVFVSDIETKYLNNFQLLRSSAEKCRNYRELETVANNLYLCTPNLKNIPAVAFKEAYKAAGSFYALKNFILYHNFYLLDDNGNKLYGDAAMDLLNEKTDKYDGQWWRLFAFAKYSIEVQDFDLRKSIEAGNRK